MDEGSEGGVVEAQERIAEMITLLSCSKDNPIGLENLIIQILKELFFPIGKDAISRTIISYLYLNITSFWNYQKVLLDFLFDRPNESQILESIINSSEYANMLQNLFTFDSLWLNIERVNKLIKIIDIELDTDSAYNIFKTIVAKFWSPTVFRILFERMDVPKVLVFLLVRSESNPFEFVAFMKQTNCLQFVSANISRREFAPSFFQVVSSVVQTTHDYFVDDFILNLDKSHPMFSVDPFSIITYGNENNIFAIPSLLPLVGVFSFNYNFNIYLYGKYTIPTYRKLGYRFSDIPYIKEAANFFMLREDAIDFAVEDPGLVKETFDGKTRVPMFEFLPRHRPSFLYVGQPMTSLVLLARLEEENPGPTPFLVIDGKTVYFENGRLFFNGTFSRPIQVGAWKQIAVLSNYSSVELLVDNEVCFKIGTKSPFFVESIGSKDDVLKSKFSVIWTITASMKVIPESQKFNQGPNLSLKPGGNALFVRTNQIAEIYSDPDVIDVLIERFEDSKDTGFFNLLISLPSYSKIGEAAFLKRLIHSMLDKEINQHIVLSFIMHLQMIKEDSIRGEVLFALLTSFNFWDSCDSDLNSYLTALYGLFPSIISQEIIESLCDRGIIDFLFSMMVTKTTVTDIVQLILKEFIVKTKNQKYSSMISELALISPYYCPYDRLEDRANRLLEPIPKFLDNVSLIMQDMNPVIPIETRLKLALEMPINLATNLIVPYLLSLRSADVPEDLIPAFSRVMQRFADVYIIWMILISLLLDIPINLDAPTIRPGNIKRPIFVCPLLMMANCLIFTKSVCKENIYELLSNILPTSPNLYTQNNIMPYFVDFLCCGDRNVQLEFPSIEGQKDIAQSIKKIFPDLKFIQDITKYKTKQPPLQHTEFASAFLMKIALQQPDLEGFLMIVANFANDNIYQLFLQRTLSELIYKNEEKKVNSFIKPLVWSIVNRYATIVIESAFTMILDFCSQNITRILKFVNIFVISLSTMPPEILQRFLELITAFGAAPSQKSIFLSFYILYHILNSLIPKELPFIQKYVNDLKAQIQNYEVEESLQEFANLVRQSENVNDIVMTHQMAKILSDHFLNQMLSIQTITDSKIDVPIKDFSLLVNWYVRQQYKIIATAEAVSKRFLIILDIRMRSDETIKAKNILNRNNHFLQKASKEELQKWTKSYRVTPFYKPPKVPSFVVPTPFELHPPNQKEINFELEKFEPKMGNNIFAKSKHILSEFAFSMTFSFDEMIKALYPNVSFVNSSIVRLYTRLPSVSFQAQSKDKLMIIAGAVLGSENKIETIEEDEMFIDFINECSIGSFGPFNLVLGHPVLEVEVSDSLISSYSCCSQQSYLIYSRKNGVFILEVESSLGIPFRQFSIELKKSEWARGDLSTMDYLLAVNFAARRSFADLSSYPIFPRILMDATNPISDHTPIRDLSKTIQIVGDKDSEHAIFRQRFEVQKYFYTDNLSNPHSVSSFLVRLSPFCLYQWKVDGQWDAGDRNVLDLGKHLSITSQTTYEIIPELYCFGDSLKNWHNFKLPDGASLDAVLPKFYRNYSEFVDSLRELLESDRVRQNLDKWIDLVFGIKQNSEEDFNIYYPLSYTKNSDTKENKKEWIETCGQLPNQVFKEKHPQSIKLNKKLPKLAKAAQINIDLYSGFIIVSDFSGRINTSNIRHIASDGRLLVMTTIDDEAISFELTSFKELSRIRRRNILHSTISGSYFACATASPHEVVLWTAGSGRVFTIISFENAVWIQFGAFDDSIYIGGLDNIIHRYSLSGSHIKELSQDEQIILFN